MKVSDYFKDRIKKMEGLSLTACKCVPSEKYYSIGYGHYDSKIKAGDTITKEIADAIFEDDLQKICKCVDTLILSTTTQTQYNALVSFAYNVGAGSLKKSTLLKKHNSGDYAGAANEFSKWTKCGGKVLAGLVRRREEEREEYMKENTGDTKDNFFPRYIGCSINIDLIFSSIGVPSSFIGGVTARKPIAEANGITSYRGTYSQNANLINLAKSGKLKRV